MSTTPTADRDVVNDLPQSVVLAQQLAGLDSFLESALGGFHWAVLDRLEDGIYITDLQRRIRYWSKGAEKITGFTAAEALGRCCADKLLRHVDEKGNCLCTMGCPLAAVMVDGQARSDNVFLHHKDGHRVPVHVFALPVRDWQGRIIGAFETFSDATETNAAIERIHTLEAEAFLDPLTAIANRRYLENTLHARLSELRREKLAFGLVMCDVDHFKRFNDTHGHATGDEVLKMVARTLKHTCRAYDLAARWGGEEFVVLLGQRAPDKVRDIAERLRMMVEHSWLEVGGQTLHVTISAGATIARPDDDETSLFGRADELLYRSKSEGRNRVTFVE
ncbi:MAG: hypothetical protein CHACPFDD_00727 [Phycisphaerae bacterium]|nr:hypothetical protein [Phycisphaerae bacterium]